MPINVTIQPGDNLPLARLLNSGGVPPRVVDIVWDTEPTNVTDPRAGLFPIAVTGNEVLIASDASVQGGLTYTGVLQGTVTDDNGNFLVRLLDVDVAIESPPVSAFSFCDPTQWRDTLLNSPPANWEALAIDGRYWFADGVGNNSLTYIGSDNLPASFNVYWEVTATSFGVQRIDVVLDGILTSYPLPDAISGTVVGSGSIEIIPPTPTSTLVVSVQGDGGSDFYGATIALGCSPV